VKHLDCLEKLWARAREKKHQQQEVLWVWVENFMLFNQPTSLLILQAAKPATLSDTNFFFKQARKPVGLVGFEAWCISLFVFFFFFIVSFAIHSPLNYEKRNPILFRNRKTSNQPTNQPTNNIKPSKKE